VLSSLSCFCQKESKITFSAFRRWDRYPLFQYTINSINSFNVKIKGKSTGVNGAYCFDFHKFLVRTGLGYYRYSFDQIDETYSVLPNHYKNRILDYKPEGNIVPAIIYTTDKYRYNTLSINAGMGKEIFLSKDIQLVTSVSLDNYFALSSYYHITYPGPGGTDYRPFTFRYFGFSFTEQTGLQIKSGKVAIEPVVILPVFDLWKQDKIFPGEKNKTSRIKWRRGVGAGVNFSYRLN
jgi:hypothetical protein